MRARRLNLSNISCARGRESELKRQMRAAVNPCNAVVPTKRLDGSQSASLRLHASYALMFKTLQDVVLAADAVAYLPHDDRCPCDLILVPSIDDADSPIVVVESDVTDPLASERVTKMRDWFGTTGIVTGLQAAFPTRTVVSVMVWDQELGRRDMTNEAAALSNGIGPDAADADTDGGSSNTAQSSSTAAAVMAAVGDRVLVIDAEGIGDLHVSNLRRGW